MLSHYMVCFSLSNHLHAYFRTFFASKGTAKAETVFPFYQRTASCIFRFSLAVKIPVRHPGFLAVKEQILASFNGRINFMRPFFV